MQDQDRGHLVDDLAAPAARGVASRVQMAVGFGGRQALVPQMHGEAELGAQVLGELLRLGRLRALVAGHVQRIADHRLGYGVLAQDAGDGLHVGAVVRPVQRKERLRGVAQRVGDGDADAPVAHIEGGDAADQAAGLCLGGVGFGGLRGQLRARCIHLASVEQTSFARKRGGGGPSCAGWRADRRLLGVPPPPRGGSVKYSIIAT